MTKPITTDDVLFLHESVRRMYPDGVVKGHIDRQAVDGITHAAFLTLRGRPVHDTIFRQAAALMEGIIRLHPFPDGNKRTALLTACSLLAINNHHLVVPLDVILFMVNIARNTGRASGENAELVETIAAWLEARTATVPREYDKLLGKYVTKPIWRLVLLSFTGIGFIYARRKIRHWLASDTHPEYSKDMRRTLWFLFALTRGSARFATDGKGPPPAPAQR